MISRGRNSRISAQNNNKLDFLRNKNFQNAIFDDPRIFFFQPRRRRMRHFCFFFVFFLALIDLHRSSSMTLVFSKASGLLKFRKSGTDGDGKKKEKETGTMTAILLNQSSAT